MTEAPAPARTRFPGPVRRTGRVLRPVWEQTLREPYRAGRLRLAGLGWIHQQAALWGLVTMALLTCSLLLSRWWRSADLVDLNYTDRVTFVPIALAAVTLVSLAFATALIVWGALLAAPVVRLGVAVAFGLVGAQFLTTSVIDVGDGTWVLIHGPTLVEVAYGAVVVTLVVSAAGALAARRSPRSEAVLQRVLRLVAVVAVLVFFLTHLWMSATFVGKGFDSSVQSLIGGSLVSIDGAMLPLVYASAVAVTAFSLNVSRSLAEGASELSRRVLLGVVAAVVLVKLWVVLFARLDYWATYLADRGPSMARTVVSLVLLIVLVWFLARDESIADAELDRERLTYGASVGLALPYVVQILVVCLGVWMYNVLSTDELPGFVAGYPGAQLRDYGLPAAAALGLAAGVAMLAGRVPGGHGLGSGLVVVSAWCLPSMLLPLVTLEYGFSPELGDVLLTIGAAALLVAGWRRLDHSALTSVGMAVVFVWLSLSDGDYVAYVGSFLRLPGVVVTVFGLLLIVVNGSGFVNESSSRFPREARALLFIGYLVLSVAIVNWNTVSHGPSGAGDAAAAFYFLAVPIGAWLLGRELVGRRRTAALSPTATVPAVPAGPTAGGEGVGA